MAKQVVMFDFDNTIVDSLSSWYEMMTKTMFKRYNSKPSKELKDSFGVLSNKEQAELFIKLTNVNKTPQEIINEWNEIMKYNYLNNIKLIKGAKEFLYKLKSQGKKLILASATDEPLLKIVLKHFDIDIFDSIFTEGNLNLPKHDPIFFKCILKKLNTSPDNVFFFEDSFASTKSATSIGIECCSLIHEFNCKHKEEFKNICNAVIKNYNNKFIKSLKL